MVEVREAMLEDVPSILEVHARVAAEGKWIGTEAPVDAERFGQMFIHTIENDESNLFVAVDEAAVIGNLGLHPTVPGVLGIGMSIDAGHRGQGVGTALMAAAIAWARARGDVHKLELEVWPHNAAGLALYRRFGFESEGRRRRHYRRTTGELWDSIAMGLVLDDARPGSPHPDAP